MISLEQWRERIQQERAVMAEAESQAVADGNAARGAQQMCDRLLAVVDRMMEVAAIAEPVEPEPAAPQSEAEPAESSLPE